MPISSHFWRNRVNKYWSVSVTSWSSFDPRSHVWPAANSNHSKSINQSINQYQYQKKIICRKNEVTHEPANRQQPYNEIHVSETWQHTTNKLFCLPIQQNKEIIYHHILQPRRTECTTVRTCLECVLVKKHSSHLGIPGVDQTVCGQSAIRQSMLRRLIFTARHYMIVQLFWFKKL